MLDTLITLLQEESERICGTALSAEICRAILIKWGGMVSPSTQALEEARKTRWVPTKYGGKHNPGAELEHWLWRCANKKLNSGHLKSDSLPNWVKKEIENTYWLSDDVVNPFWPYVFKQARLEGIKRGDYPHWCLPNHTIFDQTTREVYHILGTYEGPCHRCGAKSTLTIDNLEKDWMRPLKLSFRLKCPYGHNHQDYMDYNGANSSITFGEPLRAYFNTLGIRLRGVSPN